MKTCTKCGESGESRKGHRQCHACELAYSKEYNARPEVQAAAEDYREAHRETHITKSVEILRRKRLERYLQVDQLKSVSCMDCGESFPPFVMEQPK